MTSSSKARTDAAAAGLLRQAMAQRTLVVLTARTDSGWMMLKSRFLPAPAGDGALCIEQPHAYRGHQRRLARGQCVGLSFRNRHTKCVLETEVIDAGDGRADGALALRWPDCVEQLQRRMYVRTKIPAQLTLPVDLQPTADAPKAERTGSSQSGMMLDVSPGGMGIAVSGGQAEPWHVGQTVRCAFQVGQRPQRWELTGRVRYCHPWSDDSLRVGLQFVDPETLRQGRAALQEIGHTAGRLRRAGHGRSAPRLC